MRRQAHFPYLKGQQQEGGPVHLSSLCLSYSNYRYRREALLWHSYFTFQCQDPARFKELMQNIEYFNVFNFKVFMHEVWEVWIPLSHLLGQVPEPLKLVSLETLMRVPAKFEKGNSVLPCT